MPMRAWMSLIMGQIEAEHPELFALEFGKIAESDFVYTVASTNIDQSAPNFDQSVNMALVNGGYFHNMNMNKFLAHLSTKCSLSYCDHSPSVLVRLAVPPPTICL